MTLSLDRRITALQDLQVAVANARQSEFPRITRNLERDHRDTGLDSDAWQTFQIDFIGDVDEQIEQAQRSARTQRDQLVGPEVHATDAAPLDQLDPEALGLRTVQELVAEAHRLQQLAKLDERTQIKIKTHNDAVTRIQAELLRLTNAIQQSEDADERVSQLSSSRLDQYANYFDALLEEHDLLNGLYAPLGAILSTYAGPSVTRLRFSVRRRVAVRAWANRGENLLDLRTEGAFRLHGALERIARTELLPAWQAGDGEAAAAAVRAFSDKYSDDIRKQSALTPAATIDERRAWQRSVNAWLYSAEHVTLEYSVEYDGVDIGRLSPGTRGIVLLLLYLAVDQSETHPLIIDQPEENLDPESVYSELVELFRKASKRRQIIMVTHNANLVVNTDVDQVIVAKCGDLKDDALPDLTYLTGGLEDPVIRGEVCQVLEGGADAFRQRARRLRVHLNP